MHGATVQDEGRYAVEYILSDALGWTYEQVQHTPAPVIHEFIHRIQQERKWTNKHHEIEASKKRKK